MARNINDSDEQGGSSLNQALLNPEQQQNQQEEQQVNQPQQIGTRPRLSQAGQQPSQTVQAATQQQPAGTGTFTNLRKYLEAGRPAQQRIAQAATQRVTGLAGAAKKGIQQAKDAFGRNIEAGSLVNMGEALGQAKDIIGASRGVTYQPQQVTPPATPAAQEELPEKRLTTLPVMGAMSTSAPVEQPPAIVEPAPVEQASVTAQPQQFISPEDQARFAEIINAAYQGPMSLQEAGLYQGAAEKAREAQRTIGDVQTATGRERLLKDVFGRGRDYTAGQSRLDQLLLGTSERGVQNLQDVAQRTGNLEQVMQQAAREAAAQAGQRREEIAGIRGQAREAFTGARTEEEGLAEDYIRNIQENWNRLPEYLKTSLQQAKTVPKTSRVGDIKAGSDKDFARRQYDALLGGTTTNNWWKGTRNRPFDVYNLSPEEAAIFGLSSGNPMFFNPADIRAAQLASGEELITKDQLSRQLALQQLAGLDLSRELQKDLQYTDLEKAGTKDILSSLDTERLQKISKERQENLEKALAKDRRVIGTPSGYKEFDYLQELARAGYQKADMSGLMPDDYTRNILRDIAEGNQLSQTSGMSPDLIQRIYEKNIGNTNIWQLTDILQNLQDQLKKQKGTTSQVVSNQATQARTEGLRKLLEEIYKKDV
jgi:hypothetical protein